MQSNMITSVLDIATNSDKLDKVFSYLRENQESVLDWSKRIFFLGEWQFLATLVALHFTPVGE